MRALVRTGAVAGAPITSSYAPTRAAHVPFEPRILGRSIEEADVARELVRLEAGGPPSPLEALFVHEIKNGAVKHVVGRALHGDAVRLPDRRQLVGGAR